MGSCGSLEVRVTEASHPGVTLLNAFWEDTVLVPHVFSLARSMATVKDAPMKDIQKSGSYAHVFSVRCANEVT